MRTLQCLLVFLALFMGNLEPIFGTTKSCRQFFKRGKSKSGSQASNSRKNLNSKLVDVILENNQIYSLIAHHEKFTAEEFSTEVLYFERSEGLPKEWSADVKAWAQSKPSHIPMLQQLRPDLFTPLDSVEPIFMPLVELANEKFESRRGWGRQQEGSGGLNSFSEKNILVAKKYLTYSSYVVVRNLEGNLLGGIRNIKLPQKLKRALPEESYLNITLPRIGLLEKIDNMDFLQNEIGTYVIENEGVPVELRSKVILEVWSHLFRFLFTADPILDNHGQAFHTYGDKDSIRLYRPMGFRKLRKYTLKNGQSVDYNHLKESEVPPVVIGEGKDAEKWWPLVLTPKKAKSLNERFTLKGLKGVSPNWVVERRRQLSDISLEAKRMGALLTDLLSDLKSSDQLLVSNSLKSLFETLNSYNLEYKLFMDFLHNTSSENYSKVGVELDRASKIYSEGIVKWNEISKIVEQKISSANESELVMLAKFAAQMMKANFHSLQMVQAQIIIPIILRNSPESTRVILKELSSHFTAQQWLESLMIIIDLSLPLEFLKDPTEWDHPDSMLIQARETYSRSEQALLGLGLSTSEIQKASKTIRQALFPRDQHSSRNYRPAINENEILNASKSLYSLKNKSYKMIDNLFTLAAAEQMILDSK